jgi:phytoene synthase
MPLFSNDHQFAHAKDRAECRASIRQGSRTFFGASLLLPASVREPAYGLYAFCRLSDDAIDLTNGSLAALTRLQDRLARIYGTTPSPIAADRAMADIVRLFAIPRALPEALLEGLAWDTQSRRYEDLTDLFDYAARVAGTVGVMMTLIMGVRTPEALARACDLGIAMQLSNIARDVGEDARAGRLYLPLQWMREAGIAPERFLANPIMSDALRGVIARLLSEADRLYDRARRGIACLPLSCRPAILSAAMLYAEIGRELEKLSHDSIAHRAHVSGMRKLQLLTQALATVPQLKDESSIPPLQAVHFLIDAVAASPLPLMQPTLNQMTQRQVKPQFLRVLAIFERLERNERCEAVFPRH